ncbi:MAG: ATP-grasp domain-containing protein [Chloroflexota bacterium]
MRPIGILYEHPEWFKLLFAELERRRIPFEPLYVNEHWFDPTVREAPYSLVVNRVSPSSYLRDHAGSILYARQVLAYLRDLGTPVVNGYDAFTLETSKALQALLCERLGIRYPRARVINHPSQLAAAADGLEFPVIVKPNVGGSGALMRRFETPAALRDAARSGAVDLGIDRTALVQEYLAPEDGAIVRVEILNGEYLYAIKIFADPDEGFNLCPADICQTDAASAVAMANGSNGAVAPTPGEACDYGAAAVVAPVGPLAAKKALRIEACTPPQHIVEDAIRLVKGGGLDIGGVEYLVAARDGQPYFYDVNALSNFVTDAPNLLGFDPTARFVDYLEIRAEARVLQGVS